MTHVDIWCKGVPVRRIRKCKGLRWDPPHVLRVARGREAEASEGEQGLSWVRPHEAIVIVLACIGDR